MNESGFDMFQLSPHTSAVKTSDSRRQTIIPPEVSTPQLNSASPLNVVNAEPMEGSIANEDKSWANDNRIFDPTPMPRESMQQALDRSMNAYTELYRMKPSNRIDDDNYVTYKEGEILGSKGRHNKPKTPLSEFIVSYYPDGVQPETIIYYDELRRRQAEFKCTGCPIDHVAFEKAVEAKLKALHDKEGGNSKRAESSSSRSTRQTIMSSSAFRKETAEPKTFAHAPASFGAWRSSNNASAGTGRGSTILSNHDDFGAGRGGGGISRFNSTVDNLYKREVDAYAAAAAFCDLDQFNSEQYEDDDDPNYKETAKKTRTKKR